ncbi:MAG: ABC transporter permease subunit, partial [Desulforhopalus sp.]
MDILNEIKKGLLTSLWFVFLTFPIVVIEVDAIERTVAWRWYNALYMGIGTFSVYFLVRYLSHRSENKPAESTEPSQHTLFIHRILANPLQRNILFAVSGAVVVLFPHFFSTYQTNVMTTAFMYVVLGLGLNIVVGLAGLLDLGFVAFYAVGAYTYALLNLHFGLGFWTVLPIGGLLAAVFGILLGFPVLRLRGDYLAIVTLGFGEIIRLILENWGEFSQGPSGISNISRPGFFGIELSLDQSILYTYYLTVLLVIVAIFV